MFGKTPSTASCHYEVGSGKSLTYPPIPDVYFTLFSEELTYSINEGFSNSPGILALLLMLVREGGR